MIVHGSVAVPGDKSITHRILLLAALAPGRSRLRGALTSLDARSTARVLRQLGVRISPLRSGAPVQVVGARRLRRPSTALHCGNSGTTARLLLGVLAGHQFPAILTGDPSLRRRPMRRVTDPLSAMGAKFVGSTPDLLPIEVRGGPLFALQYRLPVSSAQIKSALLLAGLVGSVEVRLREPNGLSRDHTERLLRALGYTVATEGGWIHFSPDSTPTPLDIAIPGDTSSAAFLVGAAVLADGGALRVEQVGTNPTRIGFIDVLRRMGARIEVENEVDRYGEPVGDLIVVPSDLHGTTVLAGEIPRLIDEIPLLAVLASRAKGTTTFRDVGELRVKESDRLALIAANLRTVGVRAEVNGADLFVEGCDRPPRGRVVTEGDHRIAMAFGVLGTTRRAKIQVDNPSCSDVSFPGFWYALQRMRGRK